MTRISDIIDWCQEKTGHELRADETFVGQVDRQVENVAVCWMPDVAALECAAKMGCDLVIHHETLFFTPPENIYHNAAIDYKSWQTNILRQNLLEKYNLATLRIHGSADEICVYEAFRKQLGLKEPVKEQPGNVFRRVYEIPTTTYGKLLQDVKKILGLTHTRHTGTDMGRKVSKVAIPWGGMALSLNIVYLAGLMSLDEIDVMIAGETDAYAMFFCKEAGVDIIETSHEISEIEGIRVLANLLENNFPDISVQMYRNTKIWTWG